MGRERSRLETLADDISEFFDSTSNHSEQILSMLENHLIPPLPSERLPNITVDWKTKGMRLERFCWIFLGEKGVDMRGQRIRFQGLRNGRNLVSGECNENEFEVIDIDYRGDGDE